MRRCGGGRRSCGPSESGSRGFMMGRWYVEVGFFSTKGAGGMEEV